MAGTVQRSLDGSLTLLPDGQRLRRRRGPRHAWSGAAPTAATAVLAVVVLAVVLAVVVLGAVDTPEPWPAAPAATVQEVPPRLPAGPHVRTGMLAASPWSGSATYRLFTTTPSATAIVALVRSGDRMRGDVTTGTTTATLLRADEGWVACSTDGTTECPLVAGPAAALPAAFDPGLGTLLTSALPAMAGLATGITTTRSLDPGTGLVAARCAVVTAGPVPGGYGLTDAGSLRRAVFARGKLDLTAATSAVGPAAFVPPAAPAPLA